MILRKRRASGNQGGAEEAAGVKASLIKPQESTRPTHRMEGALGDHLSILCPILHCVRSLRQPKYQHLVIDKEGPSLIRRSLSIQTLPMPKKSRSDMNIDCSIATTLQKCRTFTLKVFSARFTEIPALQRASMAISPANM